MTIWKQLEVFMFTGPTANCGICIKILGKLLDRKLYAIVLCRMY